MRTRTKAPLASINYKQTDEKLVFVSEINGNDNYTRDQMMIREKQK